MSCLFPREKPASRSALELIPKVDGV